MSTFDHERYVSQVEQDRLFQVLIENAFDVVAVVDEETHFLYVSPSIRTLLGYTVEELIGTMAIDFMRPEHRDALLDNHRAIVKQRDFHGVVEAETRHKDGSWRLMEYAVQNRLDDPDVGGIVVNYRDITNRRSWQRALLESEERYQKAFVSSPDGIAISRLSNGVFLDVNESFERITGFAREEMIGRSSMDLNHWKNPEDRERLTGELRKNGRVRRFQGEFYNRAGETRIGQLSAEIFEFNGEMCMLTCIRDITDQVAAFNELEEASRHLREDHELLLDKNATLRDLLDHVQDQKNEFRHSLTSAVSDLLQPFIDRLRAGGGRLRAAELARFEQRLQLVQERNVQEPDDNLSRLTPRERDICDLIRDGLSSRQIAQKLGLSPETVNKHRQSIRRKLQIDHRGINLTTYLRSGQ